MLVNIKTRKTYSICVNIFLNLELMLYVFFATSHGKQPCDEIGGTAKRLTKLASLGRATSDQILPLQLCLISVRIILKE